MLRSPASSPAELLKATKIALRKAFDSAKTSEVYLWSLDFHSRSYDIDPHSSNFALRSF